MIAPFNTLLLLGLGVAETQLLLLLIYVVPLFFFLLNLQRLFKEISAENRKLLPTLLWFAMIPLIGLLWQFFIIIKTAESLRLEFNKRNIQVEEKKPGFWIGLTYCVLFCCSIIPGLGLILGGIGLYYWVNYWIKMSDYRKLLKNMNI
jgi:hypothetical protein